MSKSRDANREAVLRRLHARFERRAGGTDAGADAQLRAQVDFYVRLRAALFHEGGRRGRRRSCGPSRRCDAPHRVACDCDPAASARRIACRRCSRSRLVHRPYGSSTLVHQAFHVSGSPPSKKQRKSKAQDLDDDEPDDEEDALEGEDAEAYELPLPAKCPATIRRDIAKIIKQADAQGKTPPRMAYPWVGQRAWYDPQEHPALHEAHWRFWMQWRHVFFACALYALSDECTASRKKKSNAGQARLAFLSLNILELGFYDFLDVIENGSHDNLMWLGGKAARRSMAAKANAKGNSDATVATDLATLIRNDRGRYDAIIVRALDPYRVDEDGYQSISNLLEQTDALNPTKPPQLLLSDEALARVVIDVTGGNPPNPSWVGNKSAGTWKVLLGDARIRALTKKLKPLAKKGKQPFPAQKAYDADKEQRDDYSDFEDDEDMFTVLPPTPHLNAEDDAEPDELDEPLPAADQDQVDDEDQEELEDDEDHSSAAHNPTDDDTKSSAGDEGDDTSSKKKCPGTSPPQVQVSFQSFSGTPR
ncbi:hypothetical protein PR001_g15109 [Phytophthora rubi]|uniref:Uncharacterized protein n=1 Tax=Phytophthora rubi TaxID=129364 RepID=A0A6A3L8R7_9STRA|nr:hypothetical protein PR002_g15384 [Phytophthora rubi]KAE9014555.1 hypothetical protein PR001_g15109 [Phytophthora rubi]